MTDKPKYYIRVSSLAYYFDCPLRELMKLFPTDFGLESGRTAQNVSASIGIGVHAGAAHVKSFKSVSLDDMVDVSIASFRGEIVEGVVFDDISPNSNSSEKQIKRLSQAWYHLVAPKFEAIKVEKRLFARINDDYILSGRPDFICVGPIRDTKTGKSVHYQAQQGGYSKLSKVNKISNPDKLILDWIPRTRLDKPVSIPQEIIYDVDICEQAAMNTINRIVKEHQEFLKTGDINNIPCNPQSKMCSQKYCNAYGRLCPLTKGMRR